MEALKYLNCGGNNTSFTSGLDLQSVAKYHLQEIGESLLVKYFMFPSKAQKFIWGSSGLMVLIMRELSVTVALT